MSFEKVRALRFNESLLTQRAEAAEAEIATIRLVLTRALDVLQGKTRGVKS